MNGESSRPACIDEPLPSLKSLTYEFNNCLLIRRISAIAVLLTAPGTLTNRSPGKFIYRAHLKQQQGALHLK